MVKIKVAKALTVSLCFAVKEVFYMLKTTTVLFNQISLNSQKGIFLAIYSSKYIITDTVNLEGVNVI
jgi:hypothetical protein